MADENSDSDDGVYCELKEYIKQARMNLRKVKKKEPKVDKDDHDSDDDKEKVDEDDVTEEKDELGEMPKDLDVQENEDIKTKSLKGLDSEQESDQDHDTDNDESIEDVDEKVEQDDELEKPDQIDAIQSDKEDIATSDNDGEIVDVEHEEKSDEENNKKEIDERSDDELLENHSDSDERNIDSDEEPNNDEEKDDNESLADEVKALRSVSDLKNCFETGSESLSNIGVFRRFQGPSSDHDDEKLNEADEETNEVENNSDGDEKIECDESIDENQSLADDETALRSVNDLKNSFETNNESLSSIGAFRRLNAPSSDHEYENVNEPDEETNVHNEIKENHEKQNTDDELQATDNDSSTVDAFNVQYRYALRHTKSMRRSQPTEDINDEADETETTGGLRASEITEDSVAYNEQSDRISTYNEHLIIAQATIESLYDFIFKDPWDVLTQILDSKRSSKSSTETDGIMSCPQQIFYTNEASIKEKSDESELEQNIENSEDIALDKIDLRLNTRALSKEAKTYELERFDKNILIIFNQERILGYKPRLGTRQDVEALTQTFSPYGFDVIEYLDLNRDEIFEELKRLTEMNFTNYGCLAIAVLTHGSDMDGLRAKDRMYYQSDVIKYLKTSENPTLVTKPKVLIIQACRGSESTFAITVGRVGKITKDYDDVDEHRTYTLPVEADILIVHSTFAGKTSHRDELNGTWFIQTLCNKINELAPKEDLESIITEVKKEVAIEKSLEEYNRRTFDFDTNKQIPVIVSTLIRKLYLKKSDDNPDSSNLGDAVTDGINPVSSSRLPNCLCIFDKFEYLKNCMRYFLEDNEDDVTGRSFLDVAETLAEGYEFYAAKEQLSKAMSNHLLTMAKDCDYYKYLYFYKDGS